MKKLQELKDLVQEAIDNGATSVEQIHKSLAKKPFDMLKKINLSGAAVGRLEDFQNETIGNVYEFIRAVNQKVGEIAAERLKTTEKDRGIKGLKESTPKQCKAATKTGDQCKKNATAGSDYCHVHRPK
ncbi:hypothetical protein D1AOALGA4SA_9494 [Olavius algarvensis Delta 1 endosymbiont]|nr:hypothetical protein D1AOALGA4SA_9494 [Olavius algarvensis Delta 1 endosymbiont]